MRNFLWLYSGLPLTYLLLLFLFDRSMVRSVWGDKGPGSPWAFLIWVLFAWGILALYFADNPGSPVWVEEEPDEFDW